MKIKRFSFDLKKWTPWFVLILWVPFIFIVIKHALHYIHDPDTFWHLANG